MMACVLVALIVLLDWTGSGVPKPPWMFSLPFLFGIAGGIIVAKRAFLWSLISTLSGFVFFQPMYVIVTHIGGP